MRRGPAILVIAAALSGTAWAQETSEPSTRAQQIEQQREITSATPVLPDTDIVEQAVLWAYDKKVVQFLQGGWHGITPIVGGLVEKGGMAFGVQALRANLLGGRMIVRSSARVSTRGYQLYDFETGLPRLASDKVYLDLYLRRRDYSQLDYYGPGPRSERGARSNYRLEDTQADLSTGVHPVRWLRMGVAGGYYRPNVGPGTNSRVISSEKSYTPAVAPGIDRQTDFLRGGPLVHIDFRDNPYGPRSGGQYYARFDYYRDRRDSGFTFRRLTAETQQFIPLFNKKRVIALRAKTQMSFEGAGQRVPFYLQPSIGGADSLRGFRPFRFYDNNSVVYNAEWRWEVMSGVDGALFYDAGTVAPRPGLLDFRHIQHSAGGGLRFRGLASGAVVTRLDAGFSREGFQISFTFSDIFATPQVRTGRELSPPPGRLP